MRVFITGITGTLGQAVSKKLLDKGFYVVGYSRDELKQSQIESHKNLVLYLGDVRDQARLIEATRGCDAIYHFAALKRVEVGETNPEEFIQTNVIGTMNVLHAQRVNKIQRVTLSSTDKACLPITLYGATKFISEVLVLRNPNNVVCRYGNVLASRGSAIQTFLNAFKERGEVSITDEAMTRFFIKIDQAADFVIEKSLGFGGRFVPDMKSASILNLAKLIAQLLGVEFKYKVTGVRMIEKTHEDLTLEVNSKNSKRFTDEELNKMISETMRQL